MEKLINILLVEDDLLDQIEVRRVLDKKNILYRIKVARNGEEAFKLLREDESEIYRGKPDLIILDWNMPKMNGLEFLTALRKDPLLKDLSVFILTTSDQREDKAAALALGAAGFITKPLKLDSPSSLDAFNLMIDLMNMRN
ncbi:MAG TPA: response regulator [Cyclobacteriaceae bacterium]|nr:response regulator [Cyclobacteriaceae bacterium]